MKFIAIILLVLSAPLSLIIALIIFFQSGANVIFKQKRIGKDKKEFMIYKFKTMENNVIIPIGRIIRKLGLDEIPQLYNIIKGDMAFVGPRPLTKSDIDRLGWNNIQFNERWSVKPGITGIAQLSGICDAELSIQNDLKYVRNRSMYLDLSILFKTLFVPIIGKFTK